MKRLDGFRISMVLSGFMALIVAGGEVANADFNFGTFTNFGPSVNSPAHDDTVSMTADSLLLFFTSSRSGGYGDYDILYATRATTEDEWGQAHNLGSIINTSSIENSPHVSADGLTLYFGSDRSGGSGSNDIWFTTRATINDPWMEPENLGPTINSSAYDWAPSLSADGLSLYFTSGRPGGFGSWGDIWVTTRATLKDPWGEPENLGPTINSAAFDGAQSISADGSVLIFMSDRAGGYGAFDVWMTRRATIEDDWETPINLGSTINTSGGEGGGISPDGSILYLASTRPGGYGSYDLWQVPIEPVVDFNIDGIVDSTDMCVMVDHWGENYSLCDIGPTPFGDGIVDVQDIVVLAEYLFRGIPESTLAAHWALDETEGMFAADSVGSNDAIVIGGATWQPDSGQIDGALQLNGIDSYAVTGPILNPSEGPFSIFAWIKDGAPGQAIISQQIVANWLATDEIGNLMTELKSSDQLAGPLISETVITDGQWHRIGLVWHGSHRTLYVDGVLVAEDIQPGLDSSQMGLCIGVDKNLTPGTFFSGLIDDVRIYNQVVSP